MSALLFILLGLVFSATVFSSIEHEEAKLTDTDVLDVAEKRVTLTNAYQSLMYRIVGQMNTNEQEPQDTEIQIDDIDEKELVAALHERFAAIELNTTAWLGALYYLHAKNYFIDPFALKTKKDDTKAEKCANIAKVLAWYNDKFAAKMFVDAYRKSTGNAVEDVLKQNEPVSKIAEIIDSLLVALKKINTHFVKKFAESQTYLPYLEDAEIGFINYKGDDFFGETYDRLWGKLGTEKYVIVRDFMWTFFDYPQLTDPNKGMNTPALKQIKRKWKEIQNTDRIEKKYSHIEKILSLEDNSFRTELVKRKLSVPENFGKSKWKIQKGYNTNHETQWVFKFTKSTNN